MKKVYFAIIAVLLLFCAACAQTAPNERILENIFASLGAELEEIRLVNCELCKTSGGSTADMEGMLTERAAEMGLIRISSESSGSGGYRAATMLAAKEGRQYILTAQGTEEGVYMLISAKSTAAVSDFSLLCNELRAGGDCTLNALIIGSFRGKKEQATLEKLFEKVIREQGGRACEKMSNGSFISCSGYIAGLTEAVESDGQSINIQLAADYNEELDRTLCYIGYPLIFSDF